MCKKAMFSNWAGYCSDCNRPILCDDVMYPAGGYVEFYSVDGKVLCEECNNLYENNNDNTLQSSDM